jgi:transposase
MAKKYVVTLTEEERVQLQKLVSVGKSAARRLNHARILLLADASAQGIKRTDEEIVKVLHGGVRTVERVRQRFVEEGFDAALDPKPRPRLIHKLHGQVQSEIVALAKSDPPKGRKRWTLRLLASQLVELKCLEVSHESVRQVLKKRSEALAGEDVVHSAKGRRGVCLPDGRCAGTVSETVRSEVSRVVYGRSQQTVDCGNPRTVARQRRATRAL